MKSKTAAKFFFLLGLVVIAGSASAQTIAYSEANLASDVNVPGFASQINMSLRNTWGIAFLPGRSFFIANPNDGRVTVHDATGANALPASFSVPNPTGTGPDTPTGIVADTNTFFGSRNLVQPFVMVTQGGDVFV